MVFGCFGTVVVVYIDRAECVEGYERSSFGEIPAFHPADTNNIIVGVEERGAY